MTPDSAEPQLSDDEVVTMLRADLIEGDRVLARVIQRLIQIEDRRIHLKEACKSLFDYCTKKLRLSAGAAHRRVTAAKLAKRYPQLLRALGEGRIHLGAIGLLKDVFTDANVDELIQRAQGRSQRELEALVAEQRPRPDARSLIRKLPSCGSHRHSAPVPETASRPAVVHPGSTRTANSDQTEPTGDSDFTDEYGAAPTPPEDRASSPLPPPPESETRPAASLNGRKRPLKRFEPLSPGRHKVQFMVSDLQRARLEYAIDLMSHANPMGDLAPIIDAALALLIPELEKRFGRTKRPPPTPPRPSKDPSRVSKATLRELAKRDGIRCCFIASSGERCTAQAFLQVDHVRAKAHGGAGTADNTRFMCGPHNRFLAEQTFGRDVVADAIKRRRRTAAERKRQRLEAALREMGFANESITSAMLAVNASRWNHPRKVLLREALSFLSAPRAPGSIVATAGDAGQGAPEKLPFIE